MSRLVRWGVVLLGALLVVGCEQVFSTNLFSGLERDPSNLSLEQQVVYGQNALASGDPDKMAEAYDALADSIEGENDADLNLLAADLAIGASDLQDIYDDLAAVALDDTADLSNQADLAAGLNDVLGNVDYDYVTAAQMQLNTAVANGGTVSEEQYLMVTVGLIMQVADGAGGIENLDATNSAAVETFVVAANADLAAQGESSEYLTDLESFLTGL